MKKKLIRILILTQTFVLLAGCGSPRVETLNPNDYPDPPADQRVEVLPIYMAWDGVNGETWTYEISAEGVIEESDPPPPLPEPETGEEIIGENYDPPGGRSIWFRGISPGDVVVTFTTENDSGKVVDIQQYAVRVYDDMKLALLHEEYINLREK